MSEKIKIVLGRRNMTIAELAEKLGTSRQNLSNKLSRDNFSINELKAIAVAMNCEFEGSFLFKDTGDEI
jgi:transcriptional regulator with XRE-family HTH domain